MQRTDTIPASPDAPPPGWKDTPTLPLLGVTLAVLLLFLPDELVAVHWTCKQGVVRRCVQLHRTLASTARCQPAGISVHFVVKCSLRM
jgi:hypothetical protein